MTKVRLLSIVVSCAVGLLTVATVMEQRSPSAFPFSKAEIHLAEGEAVIPAALRALRPNYAHSVIPGGVYSQRDLTAAIKTDPLIAHHYAGFYSKHIHFVAVSADCYRYVSFRQANQIYWTRRKLRISKGEILFTDGKNYARTRCGNRLSEEPGHPISEAEPSAEALSPPAFALSEGQEALTIGTAPLTEGLQLASNLPVQAGPQIRLSTIPDLIAPPKSDAEPEKGLPGDFVSPPLPLAFIDDGMPSKLPGGSVSPVAEPPPVPIPEPRVGVSLLGICIILLRRSNVRAVHIR